MAKCKLYIGSNFGCLNFFNLDGTPMEAAPYVTLHDRKRGKYYVADSVTPNEDEASYDAVFTASVTENMEPGLLHLEVFSDSTMATMIHYDEEFATAVIVSPTPGQVNDSEGEEG